MTDHFENESFCQALRRMADLILKLRADLKAMEKIVHQGPRPNNCLALQDVRLYDRLQSGAGDTRCAKCGKGPCPWGRPLQPGEVIY